MPIKTFGRGKGYFILCETQYFIQAPDRDDPNRSYLLRFFGFATERVETITLLPPRVSRFSGLTVSPDGRSMLYSERKDESDLMLVENFR